MNDVDKSETIGNFELLSLNFELITLNADLRWNCGLVLFKRLWVEPFHTHILACLCLVFSLSLPVLVAG